MNVTNINYILVEPTSDLNWHTYKQGERQPEEYNGVQILDVKEYGILYLQYASESTENDKFYVTELKTSPTDEAFYISQKESMENTIYVYKEEEGQLVQQQDSNLNALFSSESYIRPIVSKTLYEMKEEGTAPKNIWQYSPVVATIHVDAWSEDNETFGWPVVNIPVGEKELEYSLNEFLNSWYWEGTIGEQTGWISNSTNINKITYFTNNSDKPIQLYTDENNYRTVGVGESLSFNPAINVIKFRINTGTYPLHTDLEEWLNNHIKNKLYYKVKDLAYRNILNRYKDFSPIVFFWEENDYHFSEGEQIIVDGENREVYFSMRNAVSMDGAAKLVLKKNNNLTISRGSFLTEFKFKQEEWQSTLTLKECNLNGYDAEEANAYPVFEASNLKLEKCKIEHYRMGLIGVITNLSNQVNLVIQNCYIEWLDYLMNFRLDGSGLSGLFREAQINNNYIIKTKILLKAQSNLTFNNNIIECLDNYHYRYEVDLNDNMNIKPNANNNYFLGYISIGEDTQKNLLKNRNFYYLQ